MKQRPIGPLVDALKSNGIDIEYQESIGCLPLKIKSSGLSGGIINLDSKISSQYVSSILISSPYAKTPVTLNLIGDSIVSQPYIDMTISMMIKFGAKVSKIPNANSYLIQNTGYINPTDYFIEGDASSATYPLAIAAVTKSTIEVTNIGSGSIQGDSEFAIKVLKEMGCIVSQTESSTTVTGPAQLTNIPLIDMESMTDAFLTAAVVASFAVTGTSTKITGISNQRVKECNRISAMINELSKFNVKALEMDDGIEVFGCDDIVYSKPVECYDDHRVAMSFSVLGSGLKSGSTVITDKKCTAKTWPGWWNCLENNIGATIEGVDEVEHHSAVSLKPIILIGMRGVGKTTFGKIIAKHLDRKFIDMDSFMESELSSTIPDIITTNGWDSFRLLELEMLKKVLNENSGNIIISTGGGIIELEASQDFLSLLKRNRKADILHLFQPNFSIIKTSLDADKSRPLLLKDLESIWNRRKPIYQSICNYEFVFIDQDFKRLESDLLNLVDFIVYPILIISKQSYFISLTYPNLSNIDLDVFMDVITGIDLIELRVDLLESTDTDFIALSVFQLKRLISTTGYKIPILFTVRSSSQGGNFTESIFPLVKKAFKWACEYIDIEIDGYKISREFIEVIENKGNCFIIGSFHDIKSKFQWKESIKIENSNDTFILEQGLSMKNVYNLLEPHVDIVKLIGTSRSISDSFDITSFAATNCMKPLIAINMGETGKLSRVLNSYLTPITHEKLSLKAAPGQLTLEEINNLKFLMGMQESKKFYLFGAPISESKSPLLHSTGFKKVGLKYTYDLFETDNVKEIEDFVMNNRVDGASVTIPLKQEILKSVLITSCSKAVKIINAANTITKTLNDGYFADNTDYLGIKKSFEKFELSGDLVGVVIGAGGTARAACLALFELNCTVVKVYNRGKERCQELVNEFNSKLGNIFVACEMEDLIKEDGFHLVVSTIPGNAQDEKLVNIMIGEKDIKGVLVEMAMKPRETWMIRKWKGDKVYGLDVLIEQGIEQWRRFTGISVVPENEMKKVC